MRLVIALVCLLSGFFVPVLAEDSLSENPILVTASRLSEPGGAYGNVVVLTHEDIERFGSQTLPELLSTVAGINVRQLYGNFSTLATVDMRGFGASATQNSLILINGRRLNDVDISAIDFSAISLSNIERVEIIRGGGSVLYGDGAVGGVINIITKEHGKAGMQANADLSAGSFATRILESSLRHTIGPVGYYLSLTGIVSNGYRDNNELDQKNIQAGIKFRLPRQSYFLDIFADDQSLRLPGPRNVNPGTGTNELETDRRGTSEPNNYAEKEGGHLTLGGNWLLGDQVSLTVDGGVRKKTQTSFFDDYSGFGFSSFTESILTTSSLTPRVSFQFSDFRLIAGIDYYFSRYDSDRAQTESSLGTPIHKIDIEQDSAAAYAQTTISVGKRASINAGLRIQNVSITARDIYDPTAPAAVPDSQAADFDRDDTVTMGGLGAKLKLGNGWSLFGNLEQSARFGTVDELFEYNNSFLREFSPLEPQIARTLTLGTELKGRIMHFSFNPYYMELKDEIHFNPNTFTNDNLDPTRRYGAEVSASIRTEKLSATANYTHTRAQFRDGPFDGNDVPLVPKNMASISFGWQITPAFNTMALVNYVGEKRFDNDQTNTAAMIPAYTTGDLTFKYKQGNADIALGVYNIADKYYFDYGVQSIFTPGSYNAYPLPGRHYLLTIGADF